MANKFAEQGGQRWTVDARQMQGLGLVQQQIHSSSADQPKTHQSQRGAVKEENSIQVSMLALQLQSQLHQMQVQTASEASRENDDGISLQQLCSPVRICLSVLNVQTQHKSFFKRATFQLTPNFAALPGEEIYVMTVYAVIDSQLKTLIRLDLRDIEDMERVQTQKSGQRPQFKIIQCPSIKYPVQPSSADAAPMG